MQDEVREVGFDTAGRRGRLLDAEPSEVQILVVDDDEDTSAAIRDVLMAEGYRVRCAHSGEAALSQIREAKPQLLILDLMMPGMNGWEVLSHLERIPTRSMQILVLTAASNGQEAGRSSVVSASLSKPVDLDELLEQVASLAIRAMAQGENHE